MQRAIPLLLSALLLGSTVACNKASEQAKDTTAPTTSSSKPVAQPAAAKQTAIPGGTAFDTTLQQEISTGKNKDQDRFVLKVKGGLFGGNSALKDAQVQGHLEDVVKAARGKKASLHLVFDDIQLKNGEMYPIDVTLVNTQVETATKGKFLQNVGIVLVGAAAGHFAGNKANFKHGALAGGTAAAAYVLSSPGGEVVLKKGTEVKLKLKTALNVAS